MWLNATMGFHNVYVYFLIKHVITYDYVIEQLYDK